MLENGFSSPRTDAFPAGLRVLVVDDDPTWLKILEKMLKKCSYEVTTCCLARDALSLLRERKDGYDIVISDVNMPDMDGFKLLEHVGLEMDLPVIMMSVDGETSRVMKGVQHGACDYLLKPIRMKELRNIWQHVLRKKIHEVRDIESHEGLEVLHMRHGSDQTEDSLFLSGEDFSSGKKRKNVDSKHDDFGDSSCSKKPRVVWTVELHQKFVEAVNEIGFEKVGPKRILDSMKVPWLSRENVASHLQKYRLYLSRLQKENDLKVSLNGTMHPDLYLKEATGNDSIQNLTNPHQNEVASADFVFSSCKLSVQEGNSESIVSVPVLEYKGSFIGDVHVPDVKKVGSADLGFSNPIASLESDVHYEAFEITNPTGYSWVEVPEIQFKQEREPLLQMKDSFIHPPLSGMGNNIQVDQVPLQPTTSFTSRPSIEGIDIPSQLEHNPLYDEFRDNHVTHMSSTEFGVNSPPALSTTHLANYQAFETISPTTLGMKNENCSLNGITCLEGTQRNLILGNASAPGSFNEDLQFSWLQGDYYDKSLEVQNIECSEENDPGILGEATVPLYDALRFDYEYPCDPIMF